MMYVYFKQSVIIFLIPSVAGETQNNFFFNLAKIAEVI